MQKSMGRADLRINQEKALVGAFCEVSKFAKVRFQLYCKQSPAWWHGAQCNEVPPPVGLVTGYQHSSAPPLNEINVKTGPAPRRRTFRVTAAKMMLLLGKCEKLLP